MPKKKQNPLYFIALVPDGEVHDEIMSIKHEFAENYNSKAALKSPPHITLYMPFRWKEEKEDKLFEVLEKLSMENKNHQVELENYGKFGTKAIYIDVKENEQLSSLQKNLIRSFKRELKIIDEGFEERPFHPHMTVAFRDLKKPMFWKAWNEEYKDKPFNASFQANGIILLKHDGKMWQIYKNFPLKN
ncbi:MAG: 2'-5' RNA ligase family protein [Candidatus Cyclobacteriaceae bacterium M2_1C_046]